MTISPETALDLLNNTSTPPPIPDAVGTLENLIAQEASGNLTNDQQTALDNLSSAVEQNAIEAGHLDDPGDPQAMTDQLYGTACKICEPQTPCCLFEFEVNDKSDPSRKIIWPINNGAPDKIFIIAKDPIDFKPSSKATVKLTDKQGCQDGKQGPFAIAKMVARGEDVIFDQQTLDFTVPFEIPEALAVLFPEDLLIAIYVFAMATSIQYYKNKDDIPKITPHQCGMPGNINKSLYVHPIPHCKLELSLTGEVGATFTLAGGSSINFGLVGSLTGEYGNRTLSLANAYTQSITTKPRTNQGPVKLPSVLQSLSDVQNSMNELLGSTGSTAPLTSAYTSSISVKFNSELAIDALELKGKSGSPDLEVKFGKGKIKFGVKVEGKVDLIELLLARSPKLAKEVAAVREKLADGNNAVSLSLECYVKLGSNGSVESGIKAPGNITIDSQGNFAPDFERLQPYVEGKVNIMGEIKLSIITEAEVWRFKGSASASGTVHTGWHFGVRKVDGKEQKLYHFEGIILDVQITAKATRSTNTKLDPDNSEFETFDDSFEGITSITNGTTTASETVLYEADPINKTYTLIDPSGEANQWKNI